MYMKRHAGAKLAADIRLQSTSPYYSARPMSWARGSFRNGAIEEVSRRFCRVHELQQRVAFQECSDTDGARNQCSTANLEMQQAKVVLAIDS